MGELGTVDHCAFYFSYYLLLLSLSRVTTRIGQEIWDIEGEECCWSTLTLDPQPLIWMRTESA